MSSYFSRSGSFAAGRSGHGSAGGLADRPDGALSAEPLGRPERAQRV